MHYFRLQGKRISAHVGMATIFFLVTQAHAATTYTITNLGDSLDHDSVAFDINNAGQVLGYDNDGRQDFVWSAQQGKQYITPLDGSTYGQATFINNNGQVLGYDVVNNSRQYFLWQANTGTQAIDIHGQAGEYVNITGLNDQGQVSGYFQNQNATQFTPFVWSQSNGVIRLGSLSGQSNATGQALGINNLGQIVGFSSVGNQDHAFIWSQETGMRDIGLTANNANGYFLAGYAINDLGHVVGAGTSYFRQPFFYDPNNGVTQMGALSLWDVAYGVNINDEAIGYGDPPNGATLNHSFYWSPKDGMVDLTALLTYDENTKSKLSLDRAWAINDSGQIVAEGYFGSSHKQAILLTPIPEASTFQMTALGLLGVMGLSFMRRRKCAEA